MGELATESRNDFATRVCDSTCHLRLRGAAPDELVPLGTCMVTCLLILSARAVASPAKLVSLSTRDSGQLQGAIPNAVASSVKQLLVALKLGNRDRGGSKRTER